MSEIARDEKAVAVTFRAFMYDQAAWEFLALVVVSGGLATAYQAKNKVLTRKWGLAVLGTVIVATVVAVLIAVLR